MNLYIQELTKQYKSTKFNLYLFISGIIGCLILGPKFIIGAIFCFVYASYYGNRINMLRLKLTKVEIDPDNLPKK